MAYARFSSVDHTSDVYVYASDQGFVTNVAARRLVLAEPLPERIELPDLPEAGTGVTEEEWSRASAAYLERRSAVSKIIDRSESVPIGLAHDGEEFVHETAAECADNLERLRALGYIVPDFAIRALREEDSDDLEGAR